MTDIERRYQFINKNANTAEIILYGPIGKDYFGDGISGSSFTKELKALGDVRNIDLRIDSPGGAITDARVIYSRLVEHKAKINVKIDGYAASAASWIAMAGDSIAISEGAFIMIHNARGMAFGEADELEKTAKLLRTMSDTIADTYVARTKIAKKKIVSWMNEETWFTGIQAVENGFADEMMPNKQLNNCCSWSEMFRNTPRELLPKVARARDLKNRVAQLLNNRKGN